MKIAAILAFLAVGLLSFPATSKSFCGKYEDITKKITEDFHQDLSYSAVSGKGALLEIFINEDRATFTVIIVRTDGKTCVVDSGDGWKYHYPFELGV